MYKTTYLNRNYQYIPNMELQITEIAMPAKRKVSEAAKKAQAKWRASHAEKYREKCRTYSHLYYERHHEEVLNRARSRNQNKKVSASSVSGSELSE